MCSFLSVEASTGSSSASARPWANGVVVGKERAQNSPATLGDVLYAKSKAAVPEQDWVTLVQSIAAGDQRALHALYERAHRPVFTLMMRGDYNYGAPGAVDQRVWSETGCTCVLVTSTKDTLR
jgi:hypothetical protein